MKKVLFLLLGISFLFADLMQDMCRGIGYSVSYCPSDLIQQAMKKGVDKVEKDGDSSYSVINFMLADAYHNEDKYYAFKGYFLVRLSEDSGLFVLQNGSDNNILLVYLEDLPENVRFFSGGKYIGFVKGEGAYKYESKELGDIMIPKGSIIAIERE
jgi:hypothetical protein